MGEGKGRKVREEERQRGLDVCMHVWWMLACLLSVADLSIGTYLLYR